MTAENKKLWQSVLAEIELTISKANFNMWFKDTFIDKQIEGTVFVGVPNVFVKDWLINKYHKNILKSLRTFGENIHSIEYLVIKPETKKEIAKDNKVGDSHDELPLQNYYINKEDNFLSTQIFISLFLINERQGREIKTSLHRCTLYEINFLSD